MRLRNSFWALLSRSATNPAADLVLERIRLAMLSALDQHCERDHTEVDRAIRRAKDITALWYARPDLMQAISSCREQSTAQRVLRDITAMFVGHISDARSSRFGGL